MAFVDHAVSEGRLQRLLVDVDGENFRRAQAAQSLSVGAADEA